MAQIIEFHYNSIPPPCPINGIWFCSRMTSCVVLPTKNIFLNLSIIPAPITIVLSCVLRTKLAPSTIYEGFLACLKRISLLRKPEATDWYHVMLDIGDVVVTVRLGMKYFETPAINQPQNFLIIESLKIDFVRKQVSLQNWLSGLFCKEFTQGRKRLYLIK